MNDADVLARIHQLVEEEHSLRSRDGEALDAEDATRLDELEVALDQCWDLLRQRRARRDAGLEPDDAAARSEATVEHYLQ